MVLKFTINFLFAFATFLQKNIRKCIVNRVFIFFLNQVNNLFTHFGLKRGLLLKISKQKLAEGQAQLILIDMQNSIVLRCLITEKIAVPV